MYRLHTAPLCFLLCSRPFSRYLLWEKQASPGACFCLGPLMVLDSGLPQRAVQGIWEATGTQGAHCRVVPAGRPGLSSLQACCVVFGVFGRSREGLEGELLHLARNQEPKGNLNQVCLLPESLLSTLSLHKWPLSPRLQGHFSLGAKFTAPLGTLPSKSPSLPHKALPC